MNEEKACPSLKKEYTQAKAIEAKNRLEMKGQIKRVYKCQKCKYWHLTHLKSTDYKQGYRY
jgi:RNase P subunit RPR2